jgi:hypothetical protein
MKKLSPSNKSLTQLLKVIKLLLQMAKLLKAKMDNDHVRSSLMTKT